MNIRFSHVLMVGAISILALTGCNNAETTQSSPEANSAAPVATTSTAGYAELLAVVTGTKTSVEAGDYAKAKTEFAKFEDNWKPVENGIKVKSGDSYKAIEDSLDTINAEFKGSTPNKDKVLTALQSMETTINSVSKM
ncbi:MAG: DUF4363 domain-containing protein [Tatlockia sp.]|nr:DUF4363 domain-containing protein [Tatlockia sp.]